MKNRATGFWVEFIKGGLHKNCFELNYLPNFYKSRQRERDMSINGRASSAGVEKGEEGTVPKKLGIPHLFT